MRSRLVVLTVIAVLLAPNAVGQNAGEDVWSFYRHSLLRLEVEPERNVLRIWTLVLVDGVGTNESENPARCDQSINIFDIPLSVEFDYREQLLTDAAYLANTTKNLVRLKISGSTCSTVDLPADIADGYRVLTGITLF